MTGKRLIVGLVILLAISLLSVSLMTSFNHDADAHPEQKCGDILKCNMQGGIWFCEDIGDIFCHEAHDDC